MQLLQTNCTLKAAALCLLVGTAALAAEPAVTPATPASSTIASKAPAPKIQFSELTYDFGKADSGTLIKHIYVFTNSGDAILEITGVKPGCGCTTAGDWDKRVEPTKTGTIPIQFNSAGYGGHVQKVVTVYCNDPAHPDVQLILKGGVFRPIDVNPAYITFAPGPDSLSNETRVVKIINNMEEPLTLSDLQCTNSGMQSELKTIREGKEFEVTVTALAPFVTSHIWAPIILKTSTPRMPTITINAYVNVQPAIAVLPSLINLPPGPLTNSPTLSVTIRNNTTNLISFSDPVVNIPGAELKLAQVQTGRVYTLSATFPQGFQNQLGGAMEATLKSDNPKYPIVKIPILQMPGPSGTPPPAIAPPATPSSGKTQSSASPAGNSSPLASH